jgi:hypothetical protein
MGHSILYNDGACSCGAPSNKLCVVCVQAWRLPTCQGGAVQVCPRPAAGGRVHQVAVGKLHQGALPAATQGEPPRSLHVSLPPQLPCTAAAAASGYPAFLCFGAATSTQLPRRPAVDALAVNSGAWALCIGTRSASCVIAATGCLCCLGSRLHGPAAGLPFQTPQYMQQLFHAPFVWASPFCLGCPLTTVPSHAWLNP